MKTSGLTSVVPRHVSVLLNRYGRPKIEPKFFRTRFVKIPKTSVENVIYSNLDTLCSKKNLDKACNHGKGSLVSFKYTVAVYTFVKILLKNG